jgi:carbon starvation protein
LDERTPISHDDTEATPGERRRRRDGRVLVTLLPVVAFAAVVLTAAYFVYGGALARLFRLDDSRPTPAHAQRDDLDFIPTAPTLLLPQHFSAIAAAGPVVGPILAGAMFGWAPALAWILVGAVTIGGVHDFSALVASIRHRARSIPEVVREHMSRRAYLLFLAFVWLSLVYIIVAFTDVTASAFHGVQELAKQDALGAASSATESVKVIGAGIATSSLLYLLLPIAMALVVRSTKISENLAGVAFLPLVVLAIWFGQQAPLDLQTWLQLDKPNTQRLWNMLLLGYCFLASLAPAWLLLQPRGQLGGYFLYAALGAGALGVLVGRKEIQYPAFRGWTGSDGENILTLFPFLFITIACGACSGFHSLIASGTTSKQLQRESHARPIAYGSMLLEAMVAIVSLCCLMMLTLDAAAGKGPNFLYANGIGAFLTLLGVPLALGVAFGLMAFTTFVYDTLDVCTRLGRYILQELFEWRSATGRAVATALTVAAPIPFLLWQRLNDQGALVPVWKVFWSLFGASNQLLAALTLLGVTVWLWRTVRKPWVWFVVGLPTVWMYTMSMWALAIMISRPWRAGVWTSTDGMVGSVGLVLFFLGALLLVEAVAVVLRNLPPPASRNIAEGQAPVGAR